MGEAEKRGLTNTLKGDPRPMGQRQSKVSLGTTLAQAPSGAGWKSQEPPLGKREAQINAAPDGTRKGNFRTSKARFNRARGWESPRAAVGTSKARTNAAAPKADAQVGLNGDFSRTMAFGAGEAC